MDIARRDEGACAEFSPRGAVRIDPAAWDSSPVNGRSHGAVEGLTAVNDDVCRKQFSASVVST
jgi:hypothetical protein